MKNSVSLSKRSLTMREFWKYEHLTIEEITEEIEALDKEVMYFSSIEKFLKADELQKEMNFLKEISKRKALEDFKRQQKLSARNIEHTCETNRIDIYRSWNKRVEKLRGEMNSGISKIDRDYQLKQRKLLSCFAQQEARRPAKTSPVMVDIGYLMPRIIEKRKFSDANALKIVRRKEQKKLSELTFHEQKKRFDLKLKELEQQRSREKLHFQSRLQEKIDATHKGRMEEVTQFTKFCEAQKFKASHKQIKNFVSFGKKIPPSTLPTVKEDIKRYGTALRSRNAFPRSMLRKTVAF